MPTVTFGGVGYSVVPLLFELCSFNLLQSHANGDRCEFFGKHTHPKLPHHHKKKHPTTQSCYHHNLHRNICRCHQIIPTPGNLPLTYCRHISIAAAVALSLSLRIYCRLRTAVLTVVSAAPLLPRCNCHTTTANSVPQPSYHR